MSVLNTLRERGFVAQMTHPEELERLFSEGEVVFYNGYDPTADSLTIGHFLTFMAIKHMQAAGHIPIILLGGGTGMVGDPDKPDSMRPLMTIEEIDKNIENFRLQAEKFIDFSDGKAILVNNGDWLRKLNYVEFIRDYGIHFSENRMLSHEKYKMKFEGGGLNFFELNYEVMQAYDFLELNRRYGCVLQTGGSDQWSNILSGVELIRRLESKPAYGLTFNLLSRSDGQKMGKTSKGAIWLSAEKTSPYDFYQYFRNTHDADVETYLKLMTFLPLDQIHSLTNMEGEGINYAKEVLAYEITKIVHGEEEAEKSKEAGRKLFSGGLSEDAPTTKIAKQDYSQGIDILSALNLCGLAGSNSEGRRLVSSNAVSVAGEKIGSHEHIISSSELAKGVLIQKGKKAFHKIAYD